MEWYQKVFVGKTFQRNKRRIMRQVEAGKAVPDLRLILLQREVEHHQLEIVTQDFLEKYFTDRDSLLIIGIASGDAEARELLVQITDTVYRETGLAWLRRYFLGDS